MRTPERSGTAAVLLSIYTIKADGRIQEKQGAPCRRNRENRRFFRKQAEICGRRLKCRSRGAPLLPTYALFRAPGRRENDGQSVEIY